MYKTILLPVSNKAKERSFKGFEHAIALCGETLLLLHVCPPIPNIIGGEKRKELIKKDEENAAEMLAPYIEEAENKGIRHRIIVDHGSPTESIIKTAINIHIKTIPRFLFILFLLLYTLLFILYCVFPMIYPFQLVIVLHFLGKNHTRKQGFKNLSCTRFEMPLIHRAL